MPPDSAVPVVVLAFELEGTRRGAERGSHKGNEGLGNFIFGLEGKLKSSSISRYFGR